MHTEAGRDAPHTNRLVKVGFLVCFAFAACLMISTLSKAEGTLDAHALQVSTGSR